jgi:hypothetical protein
MMDSSYFIGKGEKKVYIIYRTKEEKEEMSCRGIKR